MMFIKNDFRGVTIGSYWVLDWIQTGLNELLSILNEISTTQFYHRFYAGGHVVLIT